MNTSILFKKAHTMTKMVIKSGDDYRTTFGLCLKFLLKNTKTKVQLTGHLLKVNNEYGAWINGNTSKFNKIVTRPKVGDEVMLQKSNGEKILKIVKSVFKEEPFGTLVLIH